MSKNYRILGVLVLLITGMSSTRAQSEAVSPRLSFNMPKVVKPPIFNPHCSDSQS